MMLTQTNFNWKCAERYPIQSGTCSLALARSTNGNSSSSSSCTQSNQENLFAIYLHFSIQTWESNTYKYFSCRRRRRCRRGTHSEFIEVLSRSEHTKSCFHLLCKYKINYILGAMFSVESFFWYTQFVLFAWLVGWVLFRFGRCCSAITASFFVAFAFEATTTAKRRKR